MKVIEDKDFYEFATVAIVDNALLNLWCGKRNVLLATQRA